jgi:hypothetical protein
MAPPLENLYRDVPIFVLSTGTSLRGFDFTRLDGRVTLGINRIVEHYQPTMLHFIDTSAKETHARALRAYNGTIIAGPGAAPLDTHESAYEINPHNIPPPRRVDTAEALRNLWRRRKHVPRNFDEELFGSGAGCTGLHLAILLGGNPIYLLGYDFYQDNGTHFDEYDPTRNDPDVYGYSADCIAQLSREPWLPAIYNCNPRSRLTCFPFADIDTVLAASVVAPSRQAALVGGNR